MTSSPSLKVSLKPIVLNVVSSFAKFSKPLTVPSAFLSTFTPNFSKSSTAFSFSIFTYPVFFLLLVILVTISSS